MMVDKEKSTKNADLAGLYEQSISDIKEGEILRGIIIQIGDKDILVDIGYKSEGLIHKSEVSDPGELKVGDKIDVFLESKENDHGMVVVSHEKARKFRGWQDIVDNYKEGDGISGKIARKVRGGFMVDVGLEAFLPASLASMQDVGGADNLVGNRYKFKIVKINVARKNIVVSRKEIVEEKKMEEKQAILESLNKGDIVKGVVRNITDFGAFIDIGGGITGLLHITDMSWGRINKPTEVMNVGDEVEIKILDFDKKNMKVSLGFKQKMQNPWEDIDEKYQEAGVVSGKVVNIMPYGVFLELEKGIEGLIHISEFSWTKKFNHPSERFSIGDEVQAMVLKLDKGSQKLSLGLKQLEDDPWQGVENRFHVGDKVKGMVNTLTDYGAFVELEPGVEGLVHVSDLSWTKRVNHPKELIEKDSAIEAVILNVDEQNRRIALGVKQLGTDPWDDITKRYESGTICDGTVMNITNFGMFVELEKDLEGLLHVSEMSLDPSQRMEELYKPGDEIKVKVIHIDGVQKKIALSVKDFDEKKAPEKSALVAKEKPVDSETTAKSEGTEDSVEEAPPAKETTPAEKTPPAEEAIPAEGGEDADK
ncbi:MAG: 30S ribosomal protein S1 [Candidatus Omnitrophica bacterium]|nr:30S ribosomal protein S1 [Candidatus Omnitrophota bacterium]